MAIMKANEHSKGVDEFPLYVVNFTPVDRPDYRVGVPKKKQYKLIMDENGLTEPKIFKAVKQECDDRQFSFAYPLPAYGVAIFVY